MIVEKQFYIKHLARSLTFCADHDEPDGVSAFIENKEFFSLMESSNLREILEASVRYRHNDLVVQILHAMNPQQLTELLPTVLRECGFRNKIELFYRIVDDSALVSRIEPERLFRAKQEALAIHSQMYDSQ